MCGIFFSLSTLEHVLPKDKTVSWLRNRGPDNYAVHRETTTTTSKQYCLTFVSTVLALRGETITPQPLVDAESRSVLCWNGEAWKVFGEVVRGNDTEAIFRRFVEACKPDDTESKKKTTLDRLTNVINNITGPFSFVFYDGFQQRVLFSRDCLGRRSLLSSRDEGTLRISSVSDGGVFDEVETDGLHVIDLSTVSIQDGEYKMEVIPWSCDDNTLLRNPIPLMNRARPDIQPPALTVSSPSVAQLETELRRSLEIRIRGVPQAECNATKIAVLFSGGLDCTVLARLAHDLLPLDEPIDLLNVSFENPRVAAALKTKDITSSIYENCPDRITGRAGYGELQKVCPGRVWRFVAVDVPFTEFTAHREQVIQLMKPHNTEMDLSIACALYFASRGQGTAGWIGGEGSVSEKEYTTTARVLLSGLGADELFAGYGRHGVAFTRNGFAGLIDEIALDVGRLGQRNLGRDDRVLSHWGREARFPFLDEEFVSWATQTPVWERCGFGTTTTTTTTTAQDAGQCDGLDAEKKALRLVALKLGLTQTAREKKRAIQFGARTAKMESGRTKGTSLV